VFDQERELRIHIGFIGSEVAWWAVYDTDDRGQWRLILDLTTDPFEPDDERRRHLAACVTAWIQYADRAHTT
jgi:hypothetical protein